jgi:outer membrane protein assembly factor BamD (BamD/ComL family)
VGLCLAHLAGAFFTGQPVAQEVLSRLGVAVGFLLGGCAVAWVGKRLGMVLSRTNDLSRHICVTAADQAESTRQIVERLSGLTLAIKVGAPPQPPTTAVSAPPTAQPTDTPRAAAPDPALYEKIIALLEELREVTLMSDEQRQARLKTAIEGRRRRTLEQVHANVRVGHWAAADQLLSQLEAEFQSDHAIKECRAEFLRHHAAAAETTLMHVADRVRDLAHVGSWDRAIALANEFVQNFPANVDGRHLLTQVHRDFEASRDISFQRMYELVQANVDRRQWRAALLDAQKLLEEFPNHARAHRVRQQLKTISENAEIEERQEHEMQIQLLVKTERFAEAVRLAEEVVLRFPKSPQAVALEERLPQLRELAETGDRHGS